MPEVATNVLAPRRRRGRVTRGLAPWLFASLAACTPRALPLTPEHPAHPDAPGGRLVGPPAALPSGGRQAKPSVAPPAQPPAPEPHGHEGHPQR